MKFIFAFIGFLMATPVCYGQMSEQLFTKLPADCRPADRNHLTFGDMTKIMMGRVNGKVDLPPNDPATNEFSLILASTFAPKYRKIMDRNARGRFLYSTALYWVMTSAGDPTDSFTKYATLFRKELKIGPDVLDTMAASLALIESDIYQQYRRNELQKALQSARTALKLYSRIKDSINIAQAYLTMGTLYSSIKLYDQAIAYIDSAKRYPCRKKDCTEFWVSTVVRRYEIYMGKFHESKAKADADSILAFLPEYEQKLSGSSEPYLKDMLLAMRGKLNYFLGNYAASIAYFDSAKKLPISSGDNMLRYEPAAEIYIGLALLHLNRNDEANAILEKNSLNLTAINEPLIANERYEYEKKRGNIKNALHYLEVYNKLDAERLNYKHQGEIIEMEQRYNVAARDLQIANLKTKQSRYFSIALLVAIIVGSFIVMLLIRSHNAKRKTQGLLSKIDEMTTMQIVRIEEAAHKAQENERKRLGQELHDDLGASIAGVLNFMRIKISRENDVSEKKGLVKACEILEASYNATRSKSHDIYFRSSPNSFINMLSDNVNLFFNGTGIVVKTEFDDVETEEMDTEVKTAILYALKEAITNIIKHAKATSVELILYVDKSIVHLEISDNGAGLLKPSSGTSLGLDSIRARTEKLGGIFKIVSTRQKGTTLSLKMPTDILARLTSNSMHENTLNSQPSN